MMIMQWGHDLTFVYIAATGLQSTGEGCTCNNFLAGVGWVFVTLRPLNLFPVLNLKSVGFSRPTVVMICNPFFKTCLNTWIFWPFCCKVWKQSDAIFWGKIAPALEPFQNMDSALVLLLLGKVNGELKILQNCSKPLLSQKDDNIPQTR